MMNSRRSATSIEPSVSLYESNPAILPCRTDRAWLVKLPYEFRDHLHADLGPRGDRASWPPPLSSGFVRHRAGISAFPRPGVDWNTARRGREV